MSHHYFHIHGQYLIIKFPNLYHACYSNLWHKLAYLEVSLANLFNSVTSECNSPEGKQVLYNLFSCSAYFGLPEELDHVTTAISQPAASKCLSVWRDRGAVVVNVIHPVLQRLRYTIFLTPAMIRLLNFRGDHYNICKKSRRISSSKF